MIFHLTNKSLFNIYVGELGSFKDDKTNRTVSFNECMTMIKNISPYFDQDAIESSASTSEPLLKHPGKVFYFHRVDSDRYNIFKLNGETIFLAILNPYGLDYEDEPFDPECFFAQTLGILFEYVFELSSPFSNLIRKREQIARLSDSKVKLG